MKPSKEPSQIDPQDFSSKSYNFPLQQSSKRSISLQKSKPTITSVTRYSKSPNKQPNLANRLIQKRKSVEKKIEEMRKQKIEAEMKEVQSKPKISSRSRKLAFKAEKKILGDFKSGSPQKPVKYLFDDEMIELEEDIQLLEACLNMEKPNVIDVKFKGDFKSLPFQSSTFDKAPIGKIIHKAKEIFKTDSTKTSFKPVSNTLIRKISTPGKCANATPQRKFIKTKSPSVKQRSNSMESLTQIQFGYRSLSPYQVSIKRKVETDE